MLGRRISSWNWESKTDGRAATMAWRQGSVQMVFQLENGDFRGCVIEGVELGAGESDYATITYSVAEWCHGGHANTALVPRDPGPPEITTTVTKIIMCGMGSASSCVSVALSEVRLAGEVVEVGKDYQQQLASKVEDFESQPAWQRGNQEWATLSASTEQAHGGTYAGKIEYDFPVKEDSFVVFQRTIPMPPDTTQMKIWVYVDGSGNYLNFWLEDAAKKRWQYTFGRIIHAGWKQMTAQLNPYAGWPNGPLDGQDGYPQSPLKFTALVLDGFDETVPSQGVLR